MLAYSRAASTRGGAFGRWASFCPEVPFGGVGKESERQEKLSALRDGPCLGLARAQKQVQPW